jgi:hypothetical protein
MKNAAFWEVRSFFKEQSVPFILFLDPQFVHWHTNSRPRMRVNICMKGDSYKIPRQEVSSRTCSVSQKLKAAAPKH